MFRMGRKDLHQEADAGNSIVVQGSHENAVQVQKFGMMGLSSEEYVALMGSYTLGFANDDNKLRKGRWTMNPYVFDNTYFQEVLLGHESKYLKTEADIKLLSSPELKHWVEAYAQDNNLFFENYAKAHVKISEMGQEEHLMSEMNEDDIINGGYQENAGAHWAEKYRNYEGPDMSQLELAHADEHHDHHEHDSDDEHH